MRTYPDADNLFYCDLVLFFFIDDFDWAEGGTRHCNLVYCTYFLKYLFFKQIETPACSIIFAAEVHRAGQKSGGAGNDGQFPWRAIVIISKFSFTASCYAVTTLNFTYYEPNNYFSIQVDFWIPF
jgi:hypothetical protein